jgi:SNF2 family DNA or RNA helicase
MIRVVPLQPPLYGVSSRYSPIIVGECKSTPGMRWEPANRMWVGYADAVAATVARLKARGIAVADGALPDADGAPEVDALPLALKNLRDYQQEDVRWAVAHAGEGVMLAHDLGLGKTAMALTTARAFNQPTLVVCPNRVLSTWGDSPDPEVSEVKKWWPAAWPPRIFRGTKGGERELWNDGGNNGKGELVKRFASLDEARAALGENAEEMTSPVPLEPTLLTVCNFDVLYAWAPHLTGTIRTVVIDEAHALVGFKWDEKKSSRRSRAVADIARAADRRLFLTGTPMPNKTKDLWGILDLLSEGRFGRAFHFYLKYCDLHYVDVGKGESAKRVPKYDGQSNVEELHARLGFLMRRRTKADVALQLPPMTRKIVEVTVAGKYAPRPKPGAPDSVVRHMLELAALGTIEHAVAFAEQDVAEGQKTVVWTYKKRTAELICDLLRTNGVDANWCHGDLSAEERERRARLQPDALVCTIDSMGLGVNYLRYASVGTVAELTYEPHKLLQLEGRHHRPGARRPVLIRYIIALGTVAELIKAQIISKLDKQQKAIGKVDGTLRGDLKNESESALRRLYDAMMGGKAA